MTSSEIELHSLHRLPGQIYDPSRDNSTRPMKTVDGVASQQDEWLGPQLREFSERLVTQNTKKLGTLITNRLT